MFRNSFSSEPKLLFQEVAMKFTTCDKLLYMYLIIQEIHEYVLLVNILNNTEMSKSCTPFYISPPHPSHFPHQSMKRLGASLPQK